MKFIYYILLVASAYAFNIAPLLGQSNFPSLDSIAKDFQLEKYTCAEIYPIGQKALASVPKTIDTLSRSYADFLIMYGLALRSCRSYDQSIHVIKNALSIDTLLYSSSRPEHLQSLQTLTLNFASKGEYESALKFAQRAESATGLHLGIEHPSYVSSLNLLALQLKRTGRLKASLEAYLKAIDVTQSTKSPSHKDIGLIQSNISGLYIALDQYVKAKESITIAIENAGINYGKDSDRYFTRQSKLGQIYKDLGDYPNALKIYYTIHDFYAARDKSKDNYAIAASSLSLIHDMLGDHERAVAFQSEATAETLKSYGPNHLITAIEYNNLGLVEINAGLLDSALVHYNKALEIEFNKRQKRHWRYGLYLHNIASAYRREGEYNKALSIAKDALDQTKNTLGENHNAYGYRQQNLGLIYQGLTMHDEALSNLKEAYSLFEEKLGPYHAETMNAMVNIARTLVSLSDLESAQTYYSKIADIIETQIDWYYPSLSDQERIKFWATVSKDMSELLAFAFANADQYPMLVIKAYNLHVKTKGLSLLLDIDQRKLLRVHPDSEKLQAQIRSKRIAVANALSKSKDENELVDLQREIESLESRQSAYFKSSVRHFKKTNYFENLKSRLSPGEIIVDIVRIVRKTAPEGIIEDKYYAFIIDPKLEAPNIIQLASAQSVKSIITELKTFEGANNLNVILKENFIKPILEQRTVPEKIFVSCTGDYNYIPLSAAALTVPETQGMTISYLLDIKTIKTEKGSDFSSAALFGGPDFDIGSEDWQNTRIAEHSQSLKIKSNQVSDSLRSGAYFSPLPGTVEEVENIRDSLVQEGIEVMSYIQGSATEDNLKALEEVQPDIIHVATHGFYFDRISIDGFNPKTMRERVFVTQNPLLRSGLAFTGANTSWLGGKAPDNMDDGILTAFEIAGLDLSGCRLVVLSACESGLGDASEREGTVGLQRAFKMAGVETIIQSLWKVPDKETAELMIKFYANLGKYADVHEAFNRAQNDMAKTYDPFYWAGFVLVE